MLPPINSRPASASAQKHESQMPAASKQQLPPKPHLTNFGVLRLFFNAARIHLKDRKFQGNISVSLGAQAIMSVESSISCDITSESRVEKSVMDPANYIVKAALTTADLILDDLQHKANEFNDADLADEISLSGGHTVAIQDPTGTFGISINISVTASVANLAVLMKQQP